MFKGYSWGLKSDHWYSIDFQRVAKAFQGRNCDFRGVSGEGRFRGFMRVPGGVSGNVSRDVSGMPLESLAMLLNTNETCEGR